MHSKWVNNKNKYEEEDVALWKDCKTIADLKNVAYWGSEDANKSAVCVGQKVVQQCKIFAKNMHILFVVEIVY